MSISLGNFTDYLPPFPVNAGEGYIVEYGVGHQFKYGTSLSTINDNITLEYNDTVLLLFTAEESGLIEFYESNGEYIRESMNIHIVDDDRK